MSLNNLRNHHLSEEKVTSVIETLAALENALAEVNLNLTPEDRKKYGSINEQNKLFVNRVNDFHKSMPSLQAPQVDWAEFDKDFSSRIHLTTVIDRVETLLQNLKNARILHDYDNYQDALVDYAYTNFMAGTSTPGYEAKQRELAQFFTNRGRRQAKPESPDDTL
ncbi:hypothetical protein ACFFUE_08265 [Bergeyella porcorum]|uniref:hypothetical protein n=1 Tax=Bergeyella porcorum TaxID=1735111 RepID=UPI0035EDF836